VRRLAGLVAAALLAACAAVAVAVAQDGPQVLVVSHQRVLEETRAAQALRAQEREARTAFQADVDAAKEALAAEEEELTRLRGSLDADEFERRTAAFDQRVRATRRQTQARAAALQTTFREARDALRAEIAPILIEILRARGAEIVLDADVILVAAPSVDVTEDVIARFDDRVAPPVIDLPLFPVPEADQDADPGGLPAPDEAADAAPAEAD